MSISPDHISESSSEPTYWKHQKSISVRLVEFFGWLLGWTTYWLARGGLTGNAEALIDHAIRLRRANEGAVRTIGYLNGRRGLPALRRGELMIHGKIANRGPFANLGFYSTYHVAAPNKMRALQLIRRFEWDAISDSVEIEEGELDLPDEGAEGVLWVAPGRTFYSE